MFVDCVVVEGLMSFGIFPLCICIVFLSNCLYQSFIMVNSSPNAMILYTKSVCFSFDLFVLLFNS